MILLGLQSNSSVVLGQKGLVHIWGQNNTTSKQALGISWTVRDPDGLLVELYPDNKDIEWSDTGAGQDHEFIGGRFEFFKEGIYTIDANLYMNEDNPTVIHSYKGDLCTVGAEIPEPEPPPDEEPTKVPIWLYVGGGIIAVTAIVLATRKKGPKRGKL